MITSGAMKYGVPVSVWFAVFCSVAPPSIDWLTRFAAPKSASLASPQRAAPPNQPAWAPVVKTQKEGRWRDWFFSVFCSVEAVRRQL